MSSPSRGAMRPSLRHSLPSQSEGAGNAGGALHPRSHTQMEKGAHEHTGSAEAPGIPCVAALRLMPCSPRRRIRLVTVVGGCKRHFDPVGLKLSPPTWHQQRVSGPHGFAVRSIRRSSCAPSTSLTRFNPPCDLWRADALASTTSRPAFVTIAIRPSCRNGTGDLKPLIWGRCEAQSCPSCHLAAVLSLVIPGSLRFASRPGMTGWVVSLRSVVARMERSAIRDFAPRHRHSSLSSSRSPWRSVGLSPKVTIVEGRPIRISGHGLPTPR